MRDAIALIICATLALMLIGAWHSLVRYVCKELDKLGPSKWID